MRFLRKKASSAADEATGDDELDDDVTSNKSYTPKKGRPTPSRREAEGRRRGPVAPPPMSTREAMKRNKELRKANASAKQKLTKEERRELMRERRERMMAGDERYLMPRDRGPVKAFVRDCVDARHNLLGLFMPMALLVFASILIPVAEVQQWLTLIVMVALMGMVSEAIYNGRRITRLAREHFPREADSIKGRSIGWYAFVRASQIRRLRVPKPRLRAGDPVKIQ